MLLIVKPHSTIEGVLINLCKCRWPNESNSHISSLRVILLVWSVSDNDEDIVKMFVGNVLYNTLRVSTGLDYTGEQTIGKNLNSLDLIYISVP